jgi:hypothetical protein
MVPLGVFYWKQEQALNWAIAEGINGVIEFRDVPNNLERVQQILACPVVGGLDPKLGPE